MQYLHTASSPDSPHVWHAKIGCSTNDRPVVRKVHSLGMTGEVVNGGGVVDANAPARANIEPVCSSCCEGVGVGVFRALVAVAAVAAGRAER